MHEVLVNRLGGLSLPRKSVVRLTDRPDMTLDVYRGRKTTNQQFLSDNIKSASSVASLKDRLNRDLKKPPRLHSIGMRFGQILHAKLRMECSALNAHLYRKNIVLSPSCICNGFESPYHFLFVCLKYTVDRDMFLSNKVKYYYFDNIFSFFLLQNVTVCFD